MFLKDNNNNKKYLEQKGMIKTFQLGDQAAVKLTELLLTLATVN